MAKVRRGGVLGGAALRLPAVLLLVLLAVWPLTFRYTSIGLDVSTTGGDSAQSRFYRVRWPGDGSVLVGWIDEPASGGAGPSAGVDLGGDILQAPRRMTPRSGWNRLGFWWEDVRAGDGVRGTDGERRRQPMMLVGVPHGLFVLAALVLLVRARRRRRGPSPRR